MNTSWRWRHVTQAATQVGRGGKGRGKKTSRDQTTIMSAESACFSNAWRNGWLSWHESIICGFRSAFFFTVPVLSHFFCLYDSAIQALTRNPGHHAVDCVSRIEYWQRTFAHTHTYTRLIGCLCVCSLILRPNIWRWSVYLLRLRKVFTHERHVLGMQCGFISNINMYVCVLVGFYRWRNANLLRISCRLFANLFLSNSNFFFFCFCYYTLNWVFNVWHEVSNA